MNKFFSTLIGIVTGLFASFLLVQLVAVLFPLITGSGGDEMSQGILGTLVLVFTAPVFAVVGGVVGYKKSSP